LRIQWLSHGVVRRSGQNDRPRYICKYRGEQRQRPELEMIMNLHSDIGHLPNERTVCSPSPPGPRTVSGLEERVPGKVSRLEPLNCLARVAQISNLCTPKAFGAGRRASSLRDL